MVLRNPGADHTLYDHPVPGPLAGSHPPPWPSCITDGPLLRAHLSSHLFKAPHYPSVLPAPWDQLFEDTSGFVPPLQPPALVWGLALSGQVGSGVAHGLGKTSSLLGGTSQVLSPSLETGRHFYLHTWHWGLVTPDPEEQGCGGRGSPVLLPRVTPAGIGLPQLGGEHSDNVDEEDEVELWERGRAVPGVAPQQGGAGLWGPRPTQAPLCHGISRRSLGL